MAAANPVMPTDVADTGIFETYQCEHCRRAMPRLGCVDEHVYNSQPGQHLGIPSRTAEYYVCHFCGNRQTPPRPFTEGGGRNTTVQGDNLG